METMHVHAEANIGLSLLSDNDAGIPGVYEVNVSPGLLACEAAWAAIKTVQSGILIDAPENITLRVINPLTGQVIEPAKSGGTNHIMTELVDKVAWELPKARVTLTMDVCFSKRGVSAEWLAKTLKEAMQREMDKGTLTELADASVHFYSVKTAAVPDETPALEPKYGSDSRRDYRLKEQYNSCWIEVDTGMVEICRDGSGITVRVQAKDAAADDLMEDTVSFMDLEATLLESLEIGIGAVRQHYINTNPYGCSFDKLHPVERSNQIRLAAAEIHRATDSMEATSTIQAG